MGKFIININILNVLEHSKTHKTFFAKGAFGKVFTCEMLSASFVIKCISYKSFENKYEAKCMALK